MIDSLGLASLSTQLDILLELVCIELQITETQYSEATRSYEAVGEWLNAPDCSLARFQPEMFPQGSIAIGTTVKPRKHEEFDIDLVCVLQVDSRAVKPDTLRRLVLERICEHKTYGNMVIVKDRCIRLDYAGQFHLDIIPACPAPRQGTPGGELALLIPDRGRRSWLSTNPRGFANWFASRALPDRHERIAASVQPLPANVEAGSKATLQRIVQLYKRRRDVHFNGDDTAPRSILLTAIDGQLYEGERALTDGVVNILDRLAEIGRSHAGHSVPTVPNPTNPEENLARHWQEDRRHFESFITYAAVFREGMQRLLQSRGLEQIATVLDELFDPSGTGVVTRALSAYTQRFQKERESGVLRVAKHGAGLTTISARPRLGRFSDTHFYGSD